MSVTLFSLQVTVGGAASGTVTTTDPSEPPPSSPPPPHVAPSVFGAPALNHAFIVAMSAASRRAFGGWGIGAWLSPIRNCAVW